MFLKRVQKKLELKKVAVEVVNPMETKASAAEVVDEVCTDSEYESRTSEDPNAKPNSVEVPTKHPNPSQRSVYWWY